MPASFMCIYSTFQKGARPHATCVYRYYLLKPNNRKFNIKLNLKIIKGYFYDTSGCTMAVDTAHIFDELHINVDRFRSHLVYNRVRAWRL